MATTQEKLDIATGKRIGINTNTGVQVAPSTPSATSSKFAVGGSSSVRQEANQTKASATDLLGRVLSGGGVVGALPAASGPQSLPGVPDTRIAAAPVQAAKPPAQSPAAPAAAQTNQPVAGIPGQTIGSYGPSQQPAQAPVGPAAAPPGAPTVPAAAAPQKAAGGAFTAAEQGGIRKFTGTLNEGEQVFYAKDPVTGMTEQYVRKDPNYVTPLSPEQQAIKAAADRVAALSASAGTITDADVSGIAAAGDAAKAQYAPLISQAEEQKRQGMAKGLIAAGERGGLISTQFSGVSAVSPTVGGTWVGAGGALEKQQSAYDSTISQLKQAAINAESQARTLAKNAIVTGKKQDLSDAQKAYQDAVSKSQELAAENDKKLDLQIKAADFAKKARESAVTDIEDMLRGGAIDDETAADPLFQEQFEQFHGLTPGTGGGIFEVAKRNIKLQDIKDRGEAEKLSWENLEQMTDVLSKTPLGTPIQVGGATYYGRQKGDVSTGTEVINGRQTFYEYDKDSKRLKTTDMGFAGDPKDGWMPVETDQGSYFYNQKTKAFAPARPSMSQTAIQELFPEGSKTSPFRPGQTGIQCGALQNDCNDPSVGRIWKDSLKDKMDTAADPKWGIGLEEVQEGDTIVQSGGWTGHVLRVASRDVLPSGRVQLTAFEANMVPPYGQAITSTRTFYLDDPKNLAAARVPTRPGILGGSDAPPSGVPTIGGRPITDVFGEDTNEKRETSITEIGGRKLLVDTQTGETIREIGDTKAGPTAENRQAAIETAQGQVALIDSVLNNPQLGSVVGPTKLGRFRVPIIGAGERQDLLASVDQLIQKETLSSLLELKKGGGTLGALSDQERLMLQGAATKLGNLANRKDGKLTGFSGSEAVFKAELNRIKTLAAKAIAAASSSSIDSIPMGGTYTDDMGEEYEIID